jgi:hypothetical protein
MVKLSPDEQQELVRAHPAAFEPSSGAWGRQGCTNVRLSAADEATVRGALLLAWEGVVAKPGREAVPRAGLRRTGRGPRRR